MVPFGVCSGDYDNYTCTCNAGFDSPYNPDGSIIDTICDSKSGKQFILLNEYENFLIKPS